MNDNCFPTLFGNIPTKNTVKNSFKRDGNGPKTNVQKEQDNQ